MDARQRLTFALLHAAVAPWWLAMILVPRSRLTAWLMERLPAALAVLGASYIALVARSMGGEPLDISDPDALRGLLATPEGFLAGWTHYLVFDLFVGRWIWRTALDEGRRCRVALLLTFMFGPAGLTLFAAQRRLRPAGGPVPAYSGRRR